MEAKPIANFRYRREAEMARGLLNNADIPCVIQSAEGSGFGPIGGGTTILVRPQDVVRARRLLEDEGMIGEDSDDS